MADTFVVILLTRLYQGTNDYGRPGDVVVLTAKTMIQHLKDES